MLKRIINKINAELSIRLLKKDPISKAAITNGVKLERLGAQASWVIPAGVLNADSVCYLVGAGEDISFDIALAQKYQPKIWILDPTPRAIAHFEKVKQTYQGQAFFDLITYLPKGLWNESTTLKFYVPKNEKNVSHSAVNLQKTDHYFEAEVSTLRELMQEFGHQHIDLLKLDIEGAEYKVIDDLLQSQAKVHILCVEFDEAFHSLDKRYKNRITEKLNDLKQAGYRIVNVDHPGNYTLINKNW